MSNQHHADHLAHSALHAAEKLPPLPERKSPAGAALAGFCFGAPGLGIYFKSWADFFLPAVVIIICLLIAPATFGMSVLFGAIFCAFWGYRRAKASNEKLTPKLTSGTAPPVQCTLDQRLTTLKDLLARGIITEADYEAKKQELLKSL